MLFTILVCFDYYIVCYDYSSMLCILRIAFSCLYELSPAPCAGQQSTCVEVGRDLVVAIEDVVLKFVDVANRHLNSFLITTPTQHNGHQSS